MATFPKITSPCPYRGPLSDILDQDAVCGLCHRQVHDLSAMTERQRLAFLKSCSGETCVSYRLPLAAVALAFAAALPAAAQEANAPAPAPAPAHTPSGVDEATVVGGIPFITAATTYRYVPVAQAARLRWDDAHRRLDSRKARRDKGGR